MADRRGVFLASIRSGVDVRSGTIMSSVVGGPTGTLAVRNLTSYLGASQAGVDEMMGTLVGGNVLTGTVSNSAGSMGRTGSCMLFVGPGVVCINSGSSMRRRLILVFGGRVGSGPVLGGLPRGLFWL